MVDIPILERNPPLLFSVTRDESMEGTIINKIK